MVLSEAIPGFVLRSDLWLEESYVFLVMEPWSATCKETL